METLKKSSSRLQWLDIIGLSGFLALCLGAAGLGASLTFPSLTPWYANLSKPTWNPPNSVFGPVWTTLFVTMAIAAWLVWRERKQKKTGAAMVWFIVQLLLNCAWSGLFFALHSPAAALVDVVLLWLSIQICIGSFYQVSRTAAFLMVPYFLWVSFALCLNLAIWRLNS